MSAQVYQYQIQRTIGNGLVAPVWNFFVGPIDGPPLTGTAKQDFEQGASGAISWYCTWVYGYSVFHRQRFRRRDLPSEQPVSLLVPSGPGIFYPVDWRYPAACCVCVNLYGTDEQGNAVAGRWFASCLGSNWVLKSGDAPYDAVNLPTTIKFRLDTLAAGVELEDYQGVKRRWGVYVFSPTYGRLARVTSYSLRPGFSFRRTRRVGVLPVDKRMSAEEWEGRDWSWGGSNAIEPW